MVAPAAAAVEPATPEPGPRRSARLRGQQSQANAQLPPPLSRNTEQADQGQGVDRLSPSSSASQAQDLAKEDEAGEDGEQNQEQQEQQEKEEEGGEDEDEDDGDDEDEDGDEEADAGG